jgi:hypothetical protein
MDFSDSCTKQLRPNVRLVQVKQQAVEACMQAIQMRNCLAFLLLLPVAIECTETSCTPANVKAFLQEIIALDKSDFLGTCPCAQRLHVQVCTLTLVSLLQSRADRSAVDPTEVANHLSKRLASVPLLDNTLPQVKILFDVLTKHASLTCMPKVLRHWVGTEPTTSVLEVCVSPQSSFA